MKEDIVLAFLTAICLIGGSFLLGWTERGGNWVVGYYYYYPYWEEGIMMLFVGIVAAVGLVVWKRKTKRRSDCDNE